MKWGDFIANYHIINWPVLVPFVNPKDLHKIDIPAILLNLDKMKIVNKNHVEFPTYDQKSVWSHSYNTDHYPNIQHSQRGINAI